MGAIETASALAIVIGSVAYCAVKVIGQLESNKFKMCRCCGNECIRDVHEPTQFVEVEHGLTHATNTSTTTRPTDRDTVEITEPAPEPAPINSPRLPKYPRPRLQSIAE